MIWCLLIFPAFFLLCCLRYPSTELWNFFRYTRLFSTFISLFTLLLFLACPFSCTLTAVGHLLGVTSSPDHCFLYAPTESGTIELLLLYLFMWLSSSIGLSSSRLWGSFSILWFLIQHQYILGQSVANSFCKIEIINILDTSIYLLVTTTWLCCN